MPAPGDSTDAPDKMAFTGTHWSVVLAAKDSNPEVAHAALSELCRVYWYPLYAYVRRGGGTVEDAEDITQAFFAHLLEKNALRQVAPEKGLFRSFLLASLRNFQIKEWEKSRAQKRGGTRPPLSLEANLEDRYSHEPADLQSPEKLFHRGWALTLLEQVMTELAAEYTTAGQIEIFEALKPALAGGQLAYDTLATRFNASEGAVRVWVHRLRKRYREVLKSQVGRTVDTDAEVEEELRFLFSALE
jgi:RNA polymerase sigma-70 factor (ECF subfamily)